MSCPGGVYYWAPEIPSAGKLAGAMLSRCELVHNRAYSFQKGPGLRSRASGETKEAANWRRPQRSMRKVKTTPLAIRMSQTSDRRKYRSGRFIEPRPSRTVHLVFS